MAWQQCSVVVLFAPAGVVAGVSEHCPSDYPGPGQDLRSGLESIEAIEGAGGVLG